MSGRVAITGATGFIGSALTTRFVEDGWTVVGLSRETSDRSRCPTEMEWVLGDVTDPETCDNLLEGADWVVHLAGVGLWQADPATVRHVNVAGTRAVLKAATRQGPDRVVFTSTAGTRRVPGKAAATEDDVAPPIGAYQSGKAAAELLVDRYARERDAVTVHPTAVVGPGDDSITATLESLANGSIPAHPPGGLSLVGIEDVVDGIIAAADAGTAGEHYILGGENLTYRTAAERVATNGSIPSVAVPPTAIAAAGHLAAAVGKLTGHRVFPFSPAMASLATRHHYYSSRRAHEDLGYTYAPIEEALMPATER